MDLWKHVLAHVSAGEDAGSTLETSRRVAEAFGGRATLFDAVAADDGSLPFERSSLRVEERLDGALEARVRQLGDALAGIRLHVPAELAIMRGSLGRALLGCAERCDANLIVKAASSAEMRRMTPGGRGALHVLRQAAVPVWLCAPRKRRTQRVVAAVSLSPSQPSRQKKAERILLGAARLALLENAELHVVCVVDRARDRLYHGLLSAPQYRRYVAEDRQEIQQSLAALTARIGPRSVPHLLQGDALDVVEKLVRELDADAIALGRGEGEPGPGVRGTYFAERLFCRMERPLLLVGAESRQTSARLALRSDDEVKRPLGAMEHATPSQRSARALTRR